MVRVFDYRKPPGADGASIADYIPGALVEAIIGKF